MSGFLAEDFVNMLAMAESEVLEMKHDDCLFYVRDFRAIPADVYLAESKCESCQYYVMERDECVCDFDAEDRKANGEEPEEEWIFLPF